MAVCVCSRLVCCIFSKHYLYSLHILLMICQSSLETRLVPTHSLTHAFIHLLTHSLHLLIRSKAHTLIFQQHQHTLVHTVHSDIPAAIVIVITIIIWYNNTIIITIQREREWDVSSELYLQRLSSHHRWLCLKNGWWCSFSVFFLFHLSRWSAMEVMCICMSVCPSISQWDNFEIKWNHYDIA